MEQKKSLETPMFSETEKKRRAYLDLPLPQHVWAYVFAFDPTYRDVYDRVMDEMWMRHMFAKYPVYRRKKYTELSYRFISES